MLDLLQDIREWMKALVAAENRVGDILEAAMPHPLEEEAEEVEK